MRTVVGDTLRGEVLRGGQEQAIVPESFQAREQEVIQEQTQESELTLEQKVLRKVLQMEDEADSHVSIESVLRVVGAFRTFRTETVVVRTGWA